jgi:hypothetical protein
LVGFNSVDGIHGGFEWWERKEEIRGEKGRRRFGSGVTVGRGVDGLGAGYRGRGGAWPGAVGTQHARAVPGGDGVREEERVAGP